MDVLPFQRKLQNIPSYVQGFRTKTIQIPLRAGVTKYILSDNNRLGLPENAIVVALLNRESSAFGDTKDIDGRNVATFQTQRRGFLNLLDVKSNTILKDSNLRVISDLNSRILFFEPRYAKEISWANSTIFFSNPGVIIPDEVIELTFFYYLDCPEPNYMAKIENRIYNNINQLGPRFSKLDVRTFAGQQRYKLSRQTFTGIPGDATLIGMDFRPATLAVTVNDLDPISVATSRATFIQLKQGATSILDDFPISMLTIADQLQVSPKYIAIPPTKVNDIDWDSSYFFVSDSTLPQDNQAIQMNLLYIPNL